MSDQETIKPKKKNSIKSAKRINLKQRQFIKHYTNIDNPKTFGNGTQSVQAVYNYDSDKTAAVAANRLLNNNKVISEIEQNILELGMDSKVRLKAVKEVITGNYKQRTINTSHDKDGNEYTSISERTPTASEVLKAVDLTEKISGTYDKNKAREDMRSTVLKELMRKHTKELQRNGGRGKDAHAS